MKAQRQALGEGAKVEFGDGGEGAGSSARRGWRTRTMDGPSRNFFTSFEVMLCPKAVVRSPRK